MLVLIVEPGKTPEPKEISDSLQEMQAIVGGTIQAIYPFPEKVALVCNDDGKVLRLPYNRCLRDERGIAYDVICGTFFVCGISGDDFISLTQAQVGRYMDCFRMPEMFIGMGEQIICMPWRDDPDCWYRPKSKRRTAEMTGPIYTVFPSDPNEIPQDFDTYYEAREYGEKHFGSGKYTIESPI